jgi:hypothetical protein
MKISRNASAQGIPNLVEANVRTVGIGRLRTRKAKPMLMPSVMASASADVLMTTTRSSNHIVRNMKMSELPAAANGIIPPGMGNSGMNTL